MLPIGLYLKSGSTDAAGMETAEGFVVLKGARVNETTATASLSPGMIKTRESHFNDGHVQNLVTKEDILFSSSSAAAGFVLGYGDSGQQFWKTKDGTSLRDKDRGEMG